MAGRSDSSLRATVSALGKCFHTFVFAAYPVMIVVGSSAGAIPLDGAVVARALAMSIGLTAALLVLLKPAFPDLASRAAWLSFVFIGFNLYAVVGGAFARPAAALIYTAATAAIAAAIVRPWRSRERQPTALNLAAGLVLVVNAYSSAPVVHRNEPARAAADALIQSVASSGSAPHANSSSPDIYYVVLDAFGRPDVLRERYQLDLGPFVKALESRGFVVPSASQSNYAQTFLSVASSLNLSYLDPIAEQMKESGDRRVLGYLIQNNALTALAKRSGREVIAIGSDYSATERLANADVCLCEQYGLHEIEAAAINLTPLRALPLDRWTFEAHRRKIEQEFHHLQAAAARHGPKLVFAHLISPHPPFVFTADGRPRPGDSRMFTFEDGSHFRGPREDYIAGYRDQAQFVANRILSAIDTILNHPGPSPVIVLHGDHGPGAMWNWENVEQADTRERLGIFSAYRFPGNERPALEPTITPINGLRILANGHLGTTLPLLPDRSFASTWKRPFALVPVASTEDDQSLVSKSASPVR